MTFFKGVFDLARPLAGSLAAEVNPDPYFAIRLDATNTGITPQGFLINVFSPMVPVLNPLPGAESATFTGLFDIELFDANGDGSASYGGLGLGFRLSNSGPTAVVDMTSPHFTTLTAPGKLTIYDEEEIPVPASAVGQWDTITFFHNGFLGPLSPGDRVVLTAYGCVALPGTACPAPPDLSAIPLPAAVWLFVSALGGMIGLGRRARTFH